MTVRRAVQPAQVTVLADGTRRTVPDRLATEEPMEIRAHGPGQEPAAVAVTMRTPGHDFALATGFLASEGLLDRAGGVAGVAYCTSGRVEQQYNIVTVTTRAPFVPPAHERTFVASASCGLCGKTALDDLSVTAAPVPDGPVIAVDVLTALPDRLREVQAVFDQTGSLHAAALCRADGSVVVAREDVGRHNAIDKVVGERILDPALDPEGAPILAVSGRVSFEVMQKAAVAGIPIVVAVSAPTSLAVDVARRTGQTLVGFVREGRATVYAGIERIAEVA
ncbi:MAG: formate dehydrogenase accessory sulfurtransferase FdhD [Actinomycetes bacterium]